MVPNHHIRERLTQVHQQDLLREAEHERLLSQLPQSRHMLLLLMQLLLPLRALRIKLQKRLRRRVI